jgi:proteasome component ECM29
MLLTLIGLAPLINAAVELLDRALMKFAMADTDQQIQGHIDTLLAPVILKMGSPHVQVHQKVAELQTHVSKVRSINPV